MSKQKGFPWVNLWMLVFSIGEIWLIWHRLTSNEFVEHGGTVSYIMALPVLLVIAVTALHRMPVPFTNEYPDDPEPTITTLGSLYLDAWRTLLRQRWLLILFGGIALISMLEGVTQSLIFQPLERHRLLSGEMQNMATHPKTLIDYLQSGLASDLAFKVQNTPGRFMATLGAGTRSGTGVVAPLAIVLLLPWLGIHLKRISDHPSMGRTAGALRGMLAPIGIVALLAASASFIGGRRLVANALAEQTVSSTAFFTAPVWVWSYVFSLVAVPFLTGGLIGSLIRSIDGKFINGETFVRDAVRHLPPLMGLVLMLTIAGTLLDTPGLAFMSGGISRLPDWFGVYTQANGFVMGMARMLLMLVPYAIVRLGVGSIKGLKAGFRDWMSHKRTMIRFVALGISVIVPIELVEKAITEILGQSSASFVAALLFNVVSVAISAWLSVAGWELYRRIGSKPQEAVSHTPDE